VKFYGTLGSVLTVRVMTTLRTELSDTRSSAPTVTRGGLDFLTPPLLRQCLWGTQFTAALEFEDISFCVISLQFLTKLQG